MVVKVIDTVIRLGLERRFGAGEFVLPRVPDSSETAT